LKQKNELVYRQAAVDNTEEREEQKITHKRMLNEWTHKTSRKEKKERKIQRNSATVDQRTKKNKYIINNGTLFRIYSLR